MDNIFTTLGTLITLATAAFMLWRAKKMLPAEHASTDAEASKAYAEAASISAETVTKALGRIEILERRSISMEEEVEGLQDTLSERDKCIDTLNEELKRRDELIAEWAAGIRTLINQLKTAELIPAWEPRSFDVLPRTRD